MALPLPVFSKQPPASPLARSLAAAMRTPPTPSRPVASTFLSPARAPMPPVSAMLVSYTPPNMSTTTPPVPSQSSPQGSVSGLFARLALLSQPKPPATMSMQVPSSAAPPSDFYAPNVGTSPGHFLSQQAMRATGSPIEPYNPPPPDLGIATVGATPFVGYPPAPGPAAPMGHSAALPASGGGGYSDSTTIGGAGDAPYLMAEGSAAPAAPSVTDYQRLALYGAAGLGALWLLSRVVKA